MVFEELPFVRLEELSTLASFLHELIEMKITEKMKIFSFMIMFGLSTAIKMSYYSSILKYS